MAKTNTKPEVRFAGFKEDWLPSKLGEIGDVKMCKRIFNNQTSINGDIPFYKIGTFGKRADAFISKELYQEFRNKYPFPKKGDILLSASGTLGRIVVYDGKPAYFQDSNIVWLYNNEIKVLNEFLYFIYGNISYESEGGTIQRLYNNIILNAKFSYPESQSEQKLISNFFKNIDSLITEHKQKHEKLKALKKAMLTKMFPKQGQTVPEIRFKGFLGDWEVGMVSQLLEERNIQSPKSAEYPLMAFVANEGVTHKGERYNREFLVTNEESKKYKQTENGDFIYSSNNLETGSIGLNKYGKACISPVYSIFSPTTKAVSDFVGRLLIRKSFINKMIQWRQGVVYGQWRIHESDFLKIEVSFPQVEEQEKIGAYFKNLDVLINNHETQITKLQNIKQAFLEKMFI